MAVKLLDQARKLSPAARILLVSEIWDSLSDADIPCQLSPSQQAELDRRLKRIEKTGPTGQDWATVKRRLLKPSKP